MNFQTREIFIFQQFSLERANEIAVSDKDLHCLLT